METPEELGLPPKFWSGWRTNQAEAIEAIANSKKGVFFLDGPTGTGKSACAIGAYSKITLTGQVMARMQGDEDEHRFRCLYVTRTKQLQTQLLCDFANAKTVKGRNNYPCLLYPRRFPDFSAEHCISTKARPCKESRNCPYLLEKDAAVRAGLAVLNDSYFLAEANGPAQFSGANMVILDECDKTESALMSYIQLELAQKQLAKYHLKPPAEMDSIEAWSSWAVQAIDRLMVQYGEKDRQLAIILNMNHLSNTEIELHKDNKRISNFIHKLAGFISDVDPSWILTHFLDDNGWKITFKPVQVAKYAQEYLWKHGEFFLGMSGTILDPRIQATDLGITDYEYKRLESTFPVENRPIYFWPIVTLNWDNMTEGLPRLAEAISELLGRYPNDRVLVHTVSYRIQQYLLAHLPPDRLITHGPADREEKLELFRTSREPLVMLSPSFDRGIDLFDDQCRCVIICKMPYLDLSDKQTKARMAMPDGQRWYLLRAIQTLMQMSGRAVRSPEDHADAWILDGAFKNLFNRTRYAIPKWWQDAIIWEAIK